MRKVLLFVFVVISTFSYAWNRPFAVGGKSKAMGDVSVALVDFWSCNNNQGALGFYNKSGIGIHYDNRYLLASTSTMMVSGVYYADKIGSFALNAQFYGDHNFGKIQIGAAYARAFANVFGVALQFDYLYNYFGNGYYGHRSGFTFEVGFFGQITPNFSLALHLYNPARLKMVTYNDTKEYIPTLIRFGGAYIFDKRCTLALEVEKDLDMPLSFAGGVEYVFSKYFSLRGGVRYPKFSCSLGVGFRFKQCSIDIASSYHADLGFSPQISLLYEFNSSEK